MGMGAAGKPIQQPTQQPQMGGGKGQPSAVKPMQSQPQPGNMGGGFAPQQPQMGTLGGGQMGTQPQMGNMGGGFAPQQGTPPAMGGGKGQPGNFSNVVSPLPAYAQPYAQALVQPQQPTQSELDAAYNRNLISSAGSGLSPVRQYAQQPPQTAQPAQPQGGFGQQLAPGAVAPTQAEIERFRSMLSTPSNIPLQTVPQLSPQQVMQANRLAPQPVNQLQDPFYGAAIHSGMSPEQQQAAVAAAKARQQLPAQPDVAMNQFGQVAPQQALLQPQARPAIPAFLQQPVQAEAPRQAQQRQIQQMANARRGLLGGMR